MKSLKALKVLLCIVLSFCMLNQVFAAVVSDDDSSAFVTKAEFEAIKNNYDNQIKGYLSSVDEKIDNTIANYLNNFAGGGGGGPTAPEIGEHILFGKYEWEVAGTETPLAWTVYRVDETTGHCLLVTDRPLIKHYLHHDTTSITDPATKFPSLDIVRELNGVSATHDATCKFNNFIGKYFTESEKKLIADHGWLENGGAYSYSSSGAGYVNWTTGMEAAYRAYYGIPSGRTIATGTWYIGGWSDAHNNALAHKVLNAGGTETATPYLISILSMEDQNAYNFFMSQKTSNNHFIPLANSTTTGWINALDETKMKLQMINYMCKVVDATERACTVLYRTPGNFTGRCAFVTADGTRPTNGYTVHSTTRGVRVALWYDYAKARGIKINK